jgi:hypothetical protein
MNTQLGHWLNKQCPENRLHLLRHQPSYLTKGKRSEAFSGLVNGCWLFGTEVNS